MNGLWLAAAAASFWVTWLLMPGVGVTDTAQIFALVGSQRSSVMASLLLQLVSAMCYAPAMIGLVSNAEWARVGMIRWGAALLSIGAMGSAADAVLHLLAYAMTAPGVDRVASTPVMIYMQGQGLVILAPLLLGFFVGGAMLSIAFARRELVSRWNPWLHALAIIVALAGGAAASAGLVPARVVGWTVLGCVSLAQAWVGFAAWRAGIGWRAEASASATRRPGLKSWPSVRV